MAGHIDKIKTPEQLWKDFEDYVRFAKMHPFLQHGFYGKDAKPDYTQKERPLSWWGFKKYCKLACGISGHTVMDYVNNKDGRYPEFKDVAELIRDSIAEDNISGALAGVYDGRLASRIHGLVDKVENNINAKINNEPDLSKLTDEELILMRNIQMKISGTNTDI